MMPDTEQYCPICQKLLYAWNMEEIVEGIDDYAIFIHDDIPHDEQDLEALTHGIQ